MNNLITEWIVIVGYLFTGFSWLIQINFNIKKKKAGLHPLFILCYIIGFGFIIYDQYMMGITHLAFINVFNILFPFILLLTSLGNLKGSGSASLAPRKKHRKTKK